MGEELAFPKPQGVCKRKVLHVLQGGAAPATSFAAAAVGLMNIDAHGALGCFHTLTNSLHCRSIEGYSVQIPAPHNAIDLEFA